MERVQLTENLTLIEIESVSVAGEGRSYECWFEFFGEEGRMIVSEKRIDEEYWFKLSERAEHLLEKAMRSHYRKNFNRKNRSIFIP